MPCGSQERGATRYKYAAGATLEAISNAGQRRATLFRTSSAPIRPCTSISSRLQPDRQTPPTADQTLNVGCRAAGEEHRGIQPRCRGREAKAGEARPNHDRTSSALAAWLPKLGLTDTRGIFVCEERRRARILGR